MEHTTVGYPSPPFVSSPYLSEVDSDDALDRTSSNSNERGSTSSSSDPESPPHTSTTTNSKPRQAAAAPPPPWLPPPSSDPINAPPKQVMGRPPGYDPDRIPSSVFSPRQLTSEWSLASNESLFSIKMGNSSFSMDHLLWSQSGELYRPDDWSSYSCFTIEPTGSGDLMQTEAAEIDGEDGGAVGDDGEMEELLETRNAAPIDPEREESPASAGSTVRDERGVNTLEGLHTFGSSPRFSNESGNSGFSFAFPVFEGVASMREDTEKPRPPPLTPPVPEAATASKGPLTTPKAGCGTRWFSGFVCCPMC